MIPQPVRVRDLVLKHLPPGKDRDMILRWIEPRARRAEAKAAGNKVKPTYGTHKATGPLARADEAFSEYVRTIGTKPQPDGTRWGLCYTCGKPGSMRGGLQCGHYFPRANFAVRWHVDNARPQCVGCNSKLGRNGAAAQFKKNLTRDLGAARVNALIQLAIAQPQRKRPRDPELLEIAASYRDRMRQFLELEGGRMAHARKIPEFTSLYSTPTQETP